METKLLEWHKVYMANCAGTSVQARSLEPFLKYNFKGNPYLPWAVMERLMYEQDPEATIVKVRSENGSLVHQSHTTIETEIEGKRTVVQVYANFVSVQVVFLGKAFEETYPIQDQKYDAPKVYDQNMVNKALQRATAKCIARATGLGLSLYEKGELQFDESVEDKAKKPTPQITSEALDKLEKAKTVVTQTTPPSITASPTTEPTPVVVAIPENGTKPVVELIIDIIKDESIADKVKTVLRTFNPSFVKRYQFSISPSDSNEELTTKLSQLEDPEKFLESVRRMTQ